jgi:hypothetical protein
MLKLKRRFMPCQVIFSLCCFLEHFPPKLQEFTDSLVNYSLSSFIGNPPIGNFKPVLLTVSLDVLFNMLTTQKMRHFGPYNAAGIMKSTGLVSRN